MTNFELKFQNFRYSGNKGRFEEKFKNNVKLADTVSPRTSTASDSR